MVSTVVTQSVNTAQVFFLVALICGAIATVFALVRGAVEIALVAGAITFTAVGLLFFA
jgi:hypothetical protein